jgi:HTH-type transcriptional regulator/antitoxin HigA
MMNIKPIRTATDHAAALQEIETLMTAQLGTHEGDKLDILVTLVEAYESKHFPMALPDPISAIRFKMEQSGLGIKDLEPLIGKPNRIYEIFNGTRKLTLPMIRRLHRELKIPLESLIQV